MTYPATCHRNGAVSYWSVYRQQHVTRANHVPDEELAAMPAGERHRVRLHLALHSLGATMSVRQATRESARYARLCRHGDQWTVIEHPLPWHQGRASTGGTLTWPWAHARASWRLTRIEIALRLLGLDDDAALCGAWSAHYLDGPMRNAVEDAVIEASSDTATGKPPVSREEPCARSTKPQQRAGASA